MSTGWTGWVLSGVGWAIRAGLGLRIIMRRQPISITLAWLTLVFLAPVVGLVAYLLVGENQLGRRRLKVYQKTVAGMDEEAVGVWRHRSMEWSDPHDPYRQIALFATVVGGLPPLRDNYLELLTGAEQMLERLIQDIDAAVQHCHVQTYIWEPTGHGAAVADALARAARRGVACRVLVDGVGGRPFFKSGLPAMLREAGVNVSAGLPVGPLRALFERADLRNHRKIAVIDGRTGYVGSQNITDSMYGVARKGKYGPWIDATVRVEGPAAEALQLVFLRDWAVDSGEEIPFFEKFLPEIKARPGASAGSVVQVFPSEPGGNPVGIREALVAAINAATEEIVMTTPYFAPDDAAMMALQSAALRGVRVTLVAPRRSDSKVVAAVGRWHYLDLLQAGVRILEFTKGLLHSKVVTVDRRFAMIGSSNFDMRSFWLNFEVTLLVYDPDFASLLRFLQVAYIEDAEELDLEEWKRRPIWKVVVENAARLLGPLV